MIVDPFDPQSTTKATNGGNERSALPTASSFDEDDDNFEVAYVIWYNIHILINRIESSTRLIIYSFMCRKSLTGRDLPDLLIRYMNNDRSTSDNKTVLYNILSLKREFWLPL